MLIKDVRSFVAFAQNGYFSASQSLSLARETNGLDIGLHTFIIPKVMTANGWHGFADVNVGRD